MTFEYFVALSISYQFTKKLFSLINFSVSSTLSLFLNRPPSIWTFDYSNFYEKCSQRDFSTFFVCALDGTLASTHIYSCEKMTDMTKIFNHESFGKLKAIFFAPLCVLGYICMYPTWSFMVQKVWGTDLPLVVFNDVSLNMGKWGLISNISMEVFFSIDFYASITKRSKVGYLFKSVPTLFTFMFRAMAVYFCGRKCRYLKMYHSKILIWFIKNL